MFIDAPAAYMWHSLNAYQQNGAIIADFVGYDTPDHFIGRAPAFAAVMRGEDGEAEFPGTIRRYVIDLKAKALRQEIIIQEIMNSRCSTCASGQENTATVILPAAVPATGFSMVWRGSTWIAGHGMNFASVPGILLESRFCAAGKQ